MAVAAGLERHLPGPAGRGLGRRRGPPGVPARAADPRAAHPPRQGDLQHLHRPGAARRRRLDVRRLPRPRGAAVDRDPHPPVRRGARRARCAEGGVDGRVTTSSSTPSPCRSPGRAADVVAAARQLGLHLRLVDADRVGISHVRAAPRASTLQPRARGVRRLDGCRPRLPVDQATGDALPEALRRTTPYLTHEVFKHPPQRDRDAALPAQALGARLRARPRHDPARLLHDEAQRDHRDGAGRRCRASPTCTRSRPAEDAVGYRQLVERARGLAGRGHRLRPGLDPAQRRLAGRAGRPARDPRLPPRQRRGRTATSA